MRIALYARVSTLRQGQSQTIDQQLSCLHTYLAEQDWQVTEHTIFRDVGYSGATLTRPGLDRLRDLAANAQLDRIVITAPDRLARKYVHQTLLIEELERFGCQVLFLERPMSHDSHDQLLLQIRGAVAEYERTLISERMRRGRLMKLQMGTLLPWTRTPYGYRVDPTRPRDPSGVSVDAFEQAVVQRIFARYLEQHMTLQRLAKELHELGILTPLGKRLWSPSTIRGILTNPVYVGNVYSGRTRSQPAQARRSALQPIGHSASSALRQPPEEWLLVTHVPVLVPPETFAAVQEKLAHNRAFARRNNTTHPYLLRALVSCGCCQLGCVGVTMPKGYAYYRCRGKTSAIQFRREDRCPARQIPARQLDAVVWQDLCELLEHPDLVAHAFERSQGGQWLPQEWQARREQIRQGQHRIDTQQERWTQAYLRGIVPLEEYERRRQELTQQREQLSQQAQIIEAQGAQIKNIAATVSHLHDFAERTRQGLTSATESQKRELVELLIDRVIVTDGEVEVRYVIPLNAHGEQTRFCHLYTDYLDRESSDVYSPNRLQIRRVWSPPPEPQRHRHFGGFGKVLNLQADE